MLEFLTIIGALVGAGLGLRFKLYILAPVIIVAWALVAIDGIARGHNAWWIIGAMAMVTVSLQLGYLGMFVLRSAKHRVLANHHSQAPFPTTDIYGRRR
jgi:hypothetical protein